jgi:hypothetical protein
VAAHRAQEDVTELRRVGQLDPDPPGGRRQPLLVEGDLAGMVDLTWFLLSSR